MKKIILIILLIFSSMIHAQDYDKSWRKVVVLENESKIKSANKEVEMIYRKAKSDKNEVQIIKCFFYKSKYIQALEEDAQTKIVKNLQDEIKTISPPSKAILSLVYAKCLDSYLNKNKYQLNNRTNIDSNSEENFLSWTKNDFTVKINKAFENSLKPEQILKETSLTKYELIFDLHTNDENNTKSLFDYILLENIDYYTSKIYSWNKKEFNSDKNYKLLFASNEEFKQINLDSLKNTDIKKVIELYTKINYPEKASLIEVKRVLLLNNYFADKDDSLIKKLDFIQKRSDNVLLTQRILYEKAKFYKTKNSTTNSNYLPIAVSKYDSILAYNNRSNTLKIAAVEKRQITLKEISLNFNKYIYENQNTRAFVNYKNLDSIRVLIYKVNANLVNQKYDSVIEYITNRKVFKSQSYKLENKNDYLSHTTEFLLPQLGLGTYAIIVDGVDNSKKINYKFIIVSNNSVLQSTDGTISYQILDRKTGKPIENTIVKSEIFNLKTDKNGIATFNQKTLKKNDLNYNNIIITNKNDTLNLKESNILNYNYGYNDQIDKASFKVMFYLDRAIYRPGQIIYYKGIATKNEAKITSVIPNLKVKVTLENVNGDEINSIDLITNDFGSFSGEFIIPKSGITGDFQISADEPDNFDNDLLYNKIEMTHPIWDDLDFNYSTEYFSVEEYKRPKFEINFEPIKETYVINQNIQVKGFAKSFSGSSVSNAKVTYQITENIVERKNYTIHNSILINSETTTDSSGNFSINFKCNENKDFDKKLNPKYNYTIDVTIIDNNGETITSKTNVNIGYNAIQLIASIPEKIISTDKINIILNSTNLNNQFVATKGEVKIYIINEFDGKFKKRLFDIPEIKGISDEEFELLFPYEKNGKKIDPNDDGILVYSKKVATENDKILPLDFISNFKSGNYKLVFSAIDEFKNPIETSAKFEFHQIKDKKQYELITISQLNENPKKDGYLKFEIKTAVPELYLNYSVVYDNKTLFNKAVKSTDYSTEIIIPIEKKYKNSITLGIETIFDNNYYKQSKNCIIPTDLSKIEIEIESFRDKLEPGKTEKWSFKLKENNGKIEAEVLATMYDMSLDKFKKDYWNSLTNRSNVGNYYYGKKELGFLQDYLYNNNKNYVNDIIRNNVEATNLIWFGFDFNNPNNSNLAVEYKKQLSRKVKKSNNSKMIYGVVADAIVPLPGASIVIKGTELFYSTDVDGYFEIEATEGDYLIISFQGYTQLEAIVGKSKSYQFKLIEDPIQLSEVIITGALGIAKKDVSATTYSSKVVNERELTQAGNPNAVQSLTGRVSGLQIYNDSISYNFKTKKIILRGSKNLNADENVIVVIDGKISTQSVLSQISPDEIVSINILKEIDAIALYGSKATNGVVVVTTKKGIQQLSQVKARTDRKETAFFFPHLKTDKNGKINFSFTSPQELTEWKLRLFAHTKNAKIGYLEKSVITQKELMVFPNMPRFFREKDTITISAKISNLTAQAKNGNAILQLSDATNMENIDSKTMNVNGIKNFTVSSTGNTIVSWKIIIPEGIQAINYKIVAKADDYSDGEESIIPVLTNNILVTESIPVWVRENSKKEYVFDNLKNNTSSTLKNHLFTLEYTSNPTWLALQSLPYLMEYEHECAEQTFARLYSTILATQIINSNPKIGEVFENWRKNGRPVSKLEQNEELKSLILAETPWLKDAETEEEKRKKMALLFDLENMKNSSANSFKKLKEKQKPSGGFAWFDGGKENEYITRHILSGLGHLEKLSIDKTISDGFSEITKTAIPFLDSKFLERNSEKSSNLNSELHYLYMRSFYLKLYPISNDLKKMIDSKLENINANWVNYSVYNKGLAALILNRFGESESAKKIIVGLKETSSNNEDWGMYWIENKSGWYWYEAPIETQALLIEAFSEITKDTKSVDAMKVWLLKNKQTKNWPTTKATTEAIYALLLQGSDWISVNDNTTIKIGNEKIVPSKVSENEKEAETGYLKTSWKESEITPKMATISIENKSAVPGFGGIYWQYFEDLDKIKSNTGSGLATSKELYLKKDTNDGKKLIKISATNPLKIGDLVTVRLIITAKEDIEYVHLKDMRASCFEPTNVLSKYIWKDNLSYYMSTKDASTHFFFDTIAKGSYVLEYDIRVNNIGNFSNGITTIESMYSPEFTSHTKGIRFTTKD